MKNKIFFIAGLLLLYNFLLNCKGDKISDNFPRDNSFVIYCTPDIHDLTTIWADEYSKLNQAGKIEVRDAPGSAIINDLSSGRSLGFISGDFVSGTDKTIWKEVVGRDVIVPVFNSENPSCDEILEKGLTQDDLKAIFCEPGTHTWGSLLKNSNKGRIKAYILDNSSIKQGLAELLTTDNENIEGLKVNSGKELISSVQADIYSIGICKITDLPDAGNGERSASVKLLPIDRDGNGKIDYLEKIYDNADILARGVWIGKYPRALIKNIYSVSSEKPTDLAEVAFLKWILTDGQQHLDDNGFSDLQMNERQAKTALLDEPGITFTDSQDRYAATKAILMLAGALLVITVIVLSLFRRRTYSKALVQERSSLKNLILDENFVDIPLGLYYDKTHTWAFMEKDGTVKIGIDDFLQHITGPLTRIKMRNAGEKIKKGSQILSIIQNGKQLNIHSPVTGTIRQQNESLFENSSIINSSPYIDGWVYKIEPTKWSSEIQFLIMGGKYREWIITEFSRLKEFFSGLITQGSEGLATVLQDGGELKDGILTDLGPEIWEDFQTHFLDESK